MTIEKAVSESEATETPEELPPALSRELTLLRRSTEGKAMTVEEFQAALKGRGIGMLLLLLSLPFCFFSIPGLSTPFGVAILLIGVRITFGQKPWLPRYVRQKQIPPARLAKLLAGGVRFARMMEKIVKPRMRYLHAYPGARNLIGFGISAGGLLLVLPLPIPFSHVIPAWAVVLLATGMMEKDGLIVLLGHALTAISWMTVAVASIYGTKGIQNFFL